MEIFVYLPYILIGILAGGAMIVGIFTAVKSFMEEKEY